MTVMDHARHISVTEAAGKGVAGLVRQAATGGDVVVTRHGRPVAAVVSTRRLEELHSLEEQLRDAALVLVRAATDGGVRTSLDAAITEFGFDRGELEAELDADLAAGRE